MLGRFWRLHELAIKITDRKADIHLEIHPWTDPDTQINWISECSQGLSWEWGDNCLYVECCHHVRRPWGSSDASGPGSGEEFCPKYAACCWDSDRLALTWPVWPYSGRSSFDEVMHVWWRSIFVGSYEKNCVRYLVLSVHVKPARGYKQWHCLSCNYHKSWTMKPFRPQPQWGLFSLPPLPGF